MKLNGIKIIFLSASYAGVGKTTFAESLQKTLPNSLVTPIAGLIRQQLTNLFLDLGEEDVVFSPDVYTKTKNVETKHFESFAPFVSRELICDYSNVLQKHLGDDVWAVIFCKMASILSQQGIKYLIVDDLRRYTELEYLKKQIGVENTLSIFLDKNDLVKPVFKGSAASFEGLLKPEDFDLTFNFDANWSNTQELLDRVHVLLNTKPTL